jgi:phospholipase C
MPSPRHVLLLAGLAALTPCAATAGMADIETIVVIYAENRSFDNIFGTFPGANGVIGLKPEAYRQIDRTGAAFEVLPPLASDVLSKEDAPAGLTIAKLTLPNAPFAIDDPNGLNLSAKIATRDLVHRFYEEQMQINGGRNDKFVAYSDAGALVMGHYAHTDLKLWDIAKKYVLADNFFQGAFGGSFLNHFALACACTPFYTDADKSPARGKIAEVDSDGVSLTLHKDSPPSAMNGAPLFTTPKAAITPDFYVVNTLFPPYQPSRVRPAEGQDPAFANPASADVLPPQTMPTIGDLLSAKGIDWAWYAGGWSAALEGRNARPDPNFQYHHQPFNYFAQFAPGTAARAAHLRDAGKEGEAFIADIDAGKLPPVSFYKPQGNLNQHPDYASVTEGDEHIARLVDRLEKSPQWGHMLVIVTYDENGGFWDHVAPPKADRWGPGTRIPAVIVSPFARKGEIDHTQYDTTSILRFITKRFDLPALPGLTERDKALAANGQPPLGDLTQALAP